MLFWIIMMDTIGKRLEIALVRVGKEKQELADHLNVSPRTITRWIKNESVILDKYRHKLTKYLNVSPEELFYGEDIGEKTAAEIDEIRRQLDDMPGGTIYFPDDPFVGDSPYTDRAYQDYSAGETGTQERSSSASQFIRKPRDRGGLNRINELVSDLVASMYIAEGALDMHIAQHGGEVAVELPPIFSDIGGKTRIIRLVIHLSDMVAKEPRPTPQEKQDPPEPEG